MSVAAEHCAVSRRGGVSVVALCGEIEGRLIMEMYRSVCFRVFLNIHVFVSLLLKKLYSVVFNVYATKIFRYSIEF